MDCNGNMAAARKAKNDEFYTLREDIDRELPHYFNCFRDKVVYCNCDDPEQSNFFKYFDENFDALGLRGLVATYYSPDGASYVSGISRVGEKLVEVRTKLSGNGDFRSVECMDILASCDVVVSNPPFSLAREYISMLMESGKAFLIINNLNSAICKAVFPFLNDNRMWLGNTSPKRFLQPDGSLRSFGNVVWYTNIDIPKRHRPLSLDCLYSGNEGRYPSYDNYDAIDVSRVSDILYDYDGTMGVPVTFLEKYCPEQFEILGVTKSWCGLASKIYPEQVQVSADGSRKVVSKLNDSPARIRRPLDKGTYYECNGTEYVAMYQRILIRKMKDPGV
ncbi:MAG: hypothetical protein HDQ88_11025 [Clostridia bacterium]|nr:hypothetical protein [Clostridia bacterium]